MKLFKRIGFSISVAFCIGCALGYYYPFFDNKTKEPLPKEEELINLKRRASTFSRTQANSSLDVGFKGNKPINLNKVIADLYKGKIPNDWETELQKILDSDDDSRKKEALMALFLRWSDVDLEKSLWRAGKMGLMYSLAIKGEVLRYNAEKDPRKARAYVEEHKGLLINHLYVLKEISRHLERVSPDEARKWQEGRGHFLAGLLLDSLGEGPHYSEDTAILEEYVEGLNRKHGFVSRKIMDEWKNRQPNRAAKWEENNKGVKYEKQ